MPNARDRLRALMARWPDVDDETQTFLASLHWRIRQVVILVHGQGRTQAETAQKLGVSERTTRYDLEAAYSAFES